MASKLPSGIFVVAQREHSDALGVALGNALEIVSIGPDEEIPAEVLSRAKILVVEVDPGSRLSLARISKIRTERPSLPLVVALEQADISLTRTLIRQGISDVAMLPFDAAELSGQLLDISARMAPAQHVSLAPLVSVVRAAGGVGATTAITHLAEALTDDNGVAREVCIIDLDLQFGQVLTYLGMEQQTNVLDLLEASERLDVDLVRDAAQVSPQGVNVIGAPPMIAPLEDVDVDRLLNLLTVARQAFDFVLLDLPSNWTNWTLSAALACNEIMILTDQSITGLRQTRRVTELFDVMHVPRDKVRIVVNRVGKKLFQSISVNEVGETLSRDVSATIARDKGELQIAQDQGMLLSDTNRKAAFVKDIDRLADLLSARVSGN